MYPCKDMLSVCNDVRPVSTCIMCCRLSSKVCERVRRLGSEHRVSACGPAARAQSVCAQLCVPVCKGHESRDQVCCAPSTSMVAWLGGWVLII